MTITKRESSIGTAEPRNGMMIKELVVPDFQQAPSQNQVKREQHRLHLKAILAAVRKLLSPAISSPVFARLEEQPFRFLDLPGGK